jgi:putative ABC transport system substrate-binding protein
VEADTPALFDTRRDKLVALTARNAVLTMFQFREFVEAGGLMSYGADISEPYRQVGVYTGHVLKGASPGDLPISVRIDKLDPWLGRPEGGPVTVPTR